MRFTPGSSPRFQFRWLLLPVAVVLSACTDLGPNAACTATRSIAIEVSVTDSITGLARADSATGFVQAGSYSDPLLPYGNSATLLFGGDRLGTYSVTVTRPGYATWSRSGIAVTQKSICGSVLPVHLDALLQPGP
jgi:hypothetical protein